MALLEWQTCKSDEEWQTALAGMPAGQELIQKGMRAGTQMRRLMSLLVIGLCLLGLGGWLYHRAQAGLAQVETELRDQVTLELWTASAMPPSAPLHTDGVDRARREAELLATLAPVAPAGDAPPTITLLELTSEAALVQVVVQPAPDQPALRQTRVYRWSEAGWQRSEFTPALWGRPRRLASEHFVFDYYEGDEAAVKAAAPVLERLYVTLLHSFPTAAPPNEPVEIQVDPAKEPGRFLRRSDPSAPLVVPSPARYLAPVDLSEAELLVQSVALGLLDERVAHTPHAGQRAMVVVDWQPLLAGVLLWQLWSLDLPLAEWREPVVRWTLADSAQASPIEPSFRLDLCALHRLWMISPLELNIPMVCGQPAWDSEYLRAWRRSYVPPLQLMQLGPLAPATAELLTVTGETSRPTYPGSAVLLATVLEYAAAAYGPDSVPTLVASLGEHTSWQTLLPAVFGVSAADFEAGWHTYLAEQYGASLDQ